MNEMLLKIAINMTSVKSRAGRMTSRLRARKAVTFIEYAILALIAIIVGGIILIAMKALFGGVFTSITNSF